MILEITYDLNRPQQSYAEVIATIKCMGDWCHLMGSTWLVDTTLSAETAYGQLAKKIDQNDRLFIVKVNRGEYHGWLSAEALAWLRAKFADSASRYW